MRRSREHWNLTCDKLRKACVCCSIILKLTSIAPHQLNLEDVKKTAHTLKKTQFHKSKAMFRVGMLLLFERLLRLH